MKLKCDDSLLFCINNVRLYGSIQILMNKTSLFLYILSNEQSNKNVL